MRRTLPLGLTFAIACSLTPSQSQAQSWTVYRDSVSDCRIEYPDSLFTQEPYDAEQELQRFAGPNAQTYFRLKAIDNQDKLTPAGIKEKYLQSNIPGDVTYAKTKSGFLVLSGYRGSNIFYTKAAVSKDRRTICILDITYPRSKKRAFDAIVTRMARSFGVRG